MTRFQQVPGSLGKGLYGDDRRPPDGALEEPAVYLGCACPYSGSPSTMYCRDFASRLRTAAIFT